MVQQIYAMTVKDLKVLLGDRGALITLFVIPIVFILIMTSAGLGGVTRSDQPFEVLVVNEDGGSLAATAIGALRATDGLRLVEAADGAPLTRDAAERLIVDGQYDLAVVFPADFSARVLAAATDANAQPAVVTFVADPALGPQVLGPFAGAVQGAIGSTAARAQVPRQLGAAFEDLASQAPAEQAPLINQVGTALVARLDSGSGPSSAGGSGVRFEQAAPRGFVLTQLPRPVEQNVPGYALFGVFFIMQILATSLLGEKRDGTFRRLLAAPLSRAALLLGKLLPYYLVNLVQVALMFAIGVLVFDLRLGREPLALVVLTLAAGAAATGLGLLLAALGKTTEQVSGLAALLSIVLAALGGALFPVTFMPPLMRALSQVTPHAWALAGYQDVIVRGLGLGAILTELGALLGFAALFFAGALWRFRFE